MAIALPHTDMRLAPTLGPWLALAGKSPRLSMQDIANHGFTCIQLDAVSAGLRPRQLDRRARRDLAAFLQRCGLQASGVDFFVPHNEWIAPDRVDRAATAAIAAIEMAADLDRLPLSIALPVEELASDVADALVAAADGRGIRLVVHAEDQLKPLVAWAEAIDLSCLKIGIDPAAFLALGHDPIAFLQHQSRHLGAARLSDWRQGRNQGDGCRCMAGEGELDLMAYRLSLGLPTSRIGPVVLDLRNLNPPGAAAIRAAHHWSQAAPTLPS